MSTATTGTTTSNGNAPVDDASYPVGSASHVRRSWRRQSDEATNLICRAKYGLSDTGNAQRFALDHAGDVVFVPGLGWHHYSDGRWAPDADGEIIRRAQKTARKTRDEANGLDDAARTKRLTFAGQSEGRSKLDAMIELAQTDTRLVLHAEHLDADPMLLNVANGTVDLRTGELRKHDRADLLSRGAPVEYDADATAPRWQQFLGETFAGDADLAAYFARAVGYTLTGSTEEHVVLLPFGPGANGKSVAVNALTAALGSYATTADVETFLAGRHDGGSARPDLVRLRGVRAVFTSETTPDRAWDARLVKAIAGGDRLVARQLYKEPVEFTPAFALWVACNHLPVVDGSDEAMWRRLRPLPFTVTVKHPDHRLGDKLAGELPGILAWAVRGCLAWQSDGLGTCTAVEQAAQSYRADSSPFDQYLDDTCRFDRGAWAATRDLRHGYMDWARANGHEERLNPSRMASTLSRHGCHAEKYSGTRGWSGIRLLPIGVVDTMDGMDASSVKPA